MGTVNYRHLILLVARLVLTGTFVMAALPKIKDPVAFATSVNAFQVIDPLLSNWVALLLPWFELVIGIGILMPQIRSSSSILIAVLLMIFIGLHLSAWMRGLEISCGCFGTESAQKSTNYLWLITRNTILLTTCFLIMLSDRKGQSRMSG
jgi:uncharacterized membrane protein YphA (DoxX/SURF4 family)